MLLKPQTCSGAFYVVQLLAYLTVMNYSIQISEPTWVEFLTAS